MAKFNRSENSNRGLTTLPVKYSYSGSDVRGHWVVNRANGGFDSKQVESLSTVSVQVYEPVGRARALGFRGVKGYASSVREIAGTIVVTVIDDNPLKDLLLLHKNNNQKIHWSHDLTNGFGQGNFSSLENLLKAGSNNNEVQYTNRIAPLIPTFNLFLEYVSEYYDKSSIDYDAVTFGDRETPYEKGELSKKVAENLEGEVEYKRDRYTKKAQERFDKQIARGETEIIVSKKDFVRNKRKGFDKKTYNDTGTIAGKSLSHFDLGVPNNLNDNQFNTIGLYIEGIKFISEGVVTSVNDMVTEISYQFIARDMKPLSRYNRIANDFTSIESYLINQLKDSKGDLYNTLVELEEIEGIEEHDVNITYDTANESYGITVSAGNNTVDNLTFTTKKARRQKEGGK